MAGLKGAKRKFSQAFVSRCAKIDDKLCEDAMNKVQKLSNDLNASSDPNKIVMANFRPVLEVVMEAVEGLCSAHPFVKPVYLALKGVTTIVLAERKNRTGAATLLLKQSETMCMLFEEAIEQCVSGFEARKRDLHQALMLCNTRKVHQNADELQAVNLKLDVVLAFLLRPPNPGSERVCTFDSGPGTNVLAQAREGKAIDMGAVDDPDENGLDTSAVVEEENETVQDILSENLPRFEAILKAQTTYLETMMQDIKETLRREINTGPHERLKDPDMRFLWSDMKWKRSVESRVFAASLFDYYVDLAGQDVHLTGSAGIVQGISEAARLLYSDMPSSENATSVKDAKDDEWCLRFMNNMTVTNFIEAVDTDGSGFIKIEEINTFTQSRPSYMTNMQWVAYSARGCKVF